MTWGTYFMFYECPKCGRKYRWELVDLSDPQFGCCPGCGVVVTEVARYCPECGRRLPERREAAV